MSPMPPWLEGLLNRIQEAADSEIAHRLWKEAEVILGRQFGPKLPDAARAQAMATSISAILDRVISICEEDQHRFGGLHGLLARRNPVTVRLAIQRLRGVAEAVERVYGDLQRATVPHSDVLLLPPGGTNGHRDAHPSDQWNAAQNKVDLLLAIYRDTIAGARQIREGLSGANAANPLAVEGALAQFEIFARALQAAIEALD